MKIEAMHGVFEIARPRTGTSGHQYHQRLLQPEVYMRKTVKRRLFQSYDEEPVSGKVAPGAVDNPSRNVGHGLAYHAPH